MTTLPIESVVLGALSPVTVGLLLALLALELAGPRRLWCRALCPVGTGFKLLRLPGRAGSGPAGLTVRWNESACTCPGVPACQTRCAWGIDPRRMETYDGCTHCFACVDGCPTGALAPAFGTPGHSSRRSSQSLQNAQPVVRRPSNDGPRGGDR
jgi:ferredoxin-type protein NapH